MTINNRIARLGDGYVFAEVARRVKKYRAQNKNAVLISLGIGDVTLPLAPCITEAMGRAVDEMGNADTFRGYAPTHGYGFMTDAVRSRYAALGIGLNEDTIFIGDGAKSDCADIFRLFSSHDVLIPCPSYPAYADIATVAGRTVHILPTSHENGYLPSTDGVKRREYIIFLCSPHNPTGVCYTKEVWREWITFAQETGSVIIADTAYSAYVSGDGVRSVYELDGARRCAVEICSMSKSAGFTGCRLGWTVIPDEIASGGIRANTAWERCRAADYNGVAYIIQRGAEAALSPRGIAETSAQVEYYMTNAALMRNILLKAGIVPCGGIDAPYLWLRCPAGYTSWDTFDRLLDRGVIVTPGCGFGGEGFIRLTAFGRRADSLTAVGIIADEYGKVGRKL